MICLCCEKRETAADGLCDECLEQIVYLASTPGGCGTVKSEDR